MKVHLIHHAHTLTKEEDPERHLSPQGREESDRLAARLQAAGASPSRILHSDKQWTLETAERIATVLGADARTGIAEYPIGNEDPTEPFLAEIRAAGGDVMMVGHAEFLVRSASKLLCGDEDAAVINFRPGFCTAFCLEGSGDQWTVAYGWRQEHLAR